MRTKPLGRRSRIVGVAAAAVLALTTGCGSDTPNADPSSGPGGSSGSSGSGGSTPGSAAPLPKVTVETVIDDIAVPRFLVDLPSGQRLIGTQTGIVYVYDGDTRRPEPMLDVSAQVIAPDQQFPEQGLVGFTLAPDFDTTGTFYTFTSEPPGPDDPSESVRVDTLRRWYADPKELTAEPESEVLLRIPQRTPDHTGGGIVFDADGMLFVAVGGPNAITEPPAPDRMVEAILRLDVSKPGPYTIPADNPYAKGGGAGEVYSYGYRNPFRLAWDDEIGLVVSEVMSKEKDQQVGIATPGGYAGYPDIGATNTCWKDGVLAAGCAKAKDGRPIAAPVLEYPGSVGSVVSGAVVLRGSAYPAFKDKAVVTDWSGAVLIATPGKSPWTWQQVADFEDLAGPLWGVQTDAEGAVYLMVATPDMTGGQILRLVLD